MRSRARASGGSVKAPSAKKSLGQHFLSDPGILRRIVIAAGVRNEERVLEIGPGPGGLTRALVDAGARVWAIETDRRMIEHLEALRLPALKIIHGDALRVDYQTLALDAGGRLRLVANLPYNISGPLLARLLRNREAFVSMTVMLQREVAERLLASPGTRARGGLSVMAQCFCRVRPLMRVAPGSFQPRPKVESQVVRLDVRETLPAPIIDEEALWGAVRTGFSHRRKMIRNALRGLGPDLDRALRVAGLSGSERPEALEVSEWIALANALAQKRPREQ